jgi:hypothetical protein
MISEIPLSNFDFRPDTYEFRKGATIQQDLLAFYGGFQPYDEYAFDISPWQNDMDIRGEPANENIFWDAYPVGGGESSMAGQFRPVDTRRGIISENPVRDGFVYDNGFTVAAWVFSTAFSTNWIFVYMHPFTTPVTPWYSFTLACRNNNALISWNNTFGDNRIQEATGVVQNGNWYFLAGRIRPYRQELIVNTSVAASGGATYTPLSYNTYVASSYGDFGVKRIWDFRNYGIWSRWLEDEELFALFDDPTMRWALKAKETHFFAMSSAAKKKAKFLWQSF